MANSDLEACKKQVAKEIKAFGQQTEQICKKAKPLREEEAELAKKKDPSSDEKQRAVDLRKALQDLEKSYLTQADSASERINKILKTNVPDDKKEIPEWQKGMAPWYREMLQKEAGLDLGKDVKLTGDISIKDQKVMIMLNGKF